MMRHWHSTATGPEEMPPGFVAETDDFFPPAEERDEQLQFPAHVCDDDRAAIATLFAREPVFAFWLSRDMYFLCERRLYAEGEPVPDPPAAIITIRWREGHRVRSFGIRTLMNGPDEVCKYVDAIITAALEKYYGTAPSGSKA